MRFCDTTAHDEKPRLPDDLHRCNERMQHAAGPTSADDGAGPDAFYEHLRYHSLSTAWTNF